jgi:DnaJ-class molecular chaperone
MYEKYDYRNNAHKEVHELRQKIKSIHKDLENRKLANIPKCSYCEGSGKVYSYTDRTDVTCSCCEGEGKDYLLSTTDDMRLK